VIFLLAPFVFIVATVWVVWKVTKWVILASVVMIAVGVAFLLAAIRAVRSEVPG
jgi:hypothetical protein